MARIIVLSVEDNESAEMFAAALLEPPENGRPFVPPGVKIEAMIARPTVGCKGPHRVQGRLRSEHGWTRTQRFGWWVCSTCKKPSRTVVRDFVLNMLGGSNNLLPELTGGEPEPPHHLRPRSQGGLGGRTVNT
jgi:hypothetical protein